MSYVLTTVFIVFVLTSFSHVLQFSVCLFHVDLYDIDPRALVSCICISCTVHPLWFSSTRGSRLSSANICALEEDGAGKQLTHVSLLSSTIEPQYFSSGRSPRSNVSLVREP